MTRFFTCRSLGVACDVSCVQPFRALLALKRHCFTFVQCLISIVQNRGEMNENIFSGRTLNEPITLSSVKPLHNTILFHTYSFLLLLAENCHKHQELPLTARQPEGSTCFPESEPHKTNKTAFQLALLIHLTVNRASVMAGNVCGSK